jgi:GDPmannose 4,6-dehydratase
MPNALIFGITGQDGAYLARFLLDKGYAVTGTHRADMAPQLDGLKELNVLGTVRLMPTNYDDDQLLVAAMEASAPDEIYNLAAQSSVAGSFKAPVETGLVNGIFVGRVLETMRQVAPQARFFQASSSEIFGATDDVLLDENTPMRPRSPYGTAKAYAHHLVRNYRDAFSCHASCGILFTHESPLRGSQFVSRKITLAVARIKLGLQDELLLGNTDVHRDWGYAGDYVDAMWRMLQQDEPGDFIVATGCLHALKEWVHSAFDYAGLDAGQYVRSDAQFMRPIETLAMRADPSKAARVLGWTAQMPFETLVKTMVEADIQRLSTQY